MRTNCSPLTIQLVILYGQLLKSHITVSRSIAEPHDLIQLLNRMGCYGQEEETS